MRPDPNTYGDSMRIFHVLTTTALLLCATVLGASGQSTRIVALGDSLTAGYQLPASAALPSVLERELRARGWDVVIENAGVSGDTAAGGLERLEWSVGEDVRGVIVALGANDMLRGQDPARTAASLSQIVERLKQRGVDVLLAGMFAAPSLGEDYGSRFNRIYRDIAERHGLLLYPFLLEGVAQQPKLNFQDGIHPNAAGVEVIARGLLPTVEDFLARVSARRRG